MVTASAGPVTRIKYRFKDLMQCLLYRLRKILLGFQFMNQHRQILFPGLGKIFNGLPIYSGSTFLSFYLFERDLQVLIGEHPVIQAVINLYHAGFLHFLSLFMTRCLGSSSRVPCILSFRQFTKDLPDYFPGQPESAVPLSQFTTDKVPCSGQPPQTGCGSFRFYPPHCCQVSLDCLLTIASFRTCRYQQRPCNSDCLPPGRGGTCMTQAGFARHGGQTKKGGYVNHIRP